MASTNPSPLDVLRHKLASPPPFPWAAAYSGGRDSGTLLWALTRLAPPDQVVALHVDHGWRSDAERRAEAELVRAWCDRLGVSLRSFGPPASPAMTEAAARAYRYACFESFAAEHPASPVFLAHHADDQAETVLMRVLRGRSWRGLGGMPERRGPYWRPWLGVREASIARTAERENVPWHDDSSNASDQWTRNHLRLKVFPLLKGRFPRAVEALVSLGAAWRARAPRSELDGRWVIDRGEARLPAEAWNGWDMLERQMQLEAASAALGFPQPPGRRLLEQAAHSRRVEGAGWSWFLNRHGGLWRRVEQNAPIEYFVVAEPEREYDLGPYRVRWSETASEGALAVPADPARPVVWRSAAPGMAFASADEADWGKSKRRRRLGALDPSRRALVLQDGLVVAVIDVTRHSVLWPGPEKLNKTAIFVTLEPRSEYERR